jgi:hypothetical protein
MFEPIKNSRLTIFHPNKTARAVWQQLAEHGIKRNVIGDTTDLSASIAMLQQVVARNFS